MELMKYDSNLTPIDPNRICLEAKATNATVVSGSRDHCLTVPPLDLPHDSSEDERSDSNSNVMPKIITLSHLTKSNLKADTPEQIDVKTPYSKNSIVVSKKMRCTAKGKPNRARMIFHNSEGKFRSASSDSTVDVFSDDNVDDQATSTAPPVDPPPSLSTLTLSSTPRREPSSSIDFSCNRMEPTKVLHEQQYTPRSLHDQVVVGMDCLSAAQRSIRQNHAQEIMLKNYEQGSTRIELEKMRHNLEQQRLVLEAQKALTDEKRYLLTENQRRLLETLELTNKTLLEQDNSCSSLSLENVVKMAAETAKAVTNAVLEGKLSDKDTRRDFLQCQEAANKTEPPSHTRHGSNGISTTHHSLVTVSSDNIPTETASELARRESRLEYAGSPRSNLTSAIIRQKTDETTSAVGNHVSNVGNSLKESCSLTGAESSTKYSFSRMISNGSESYIDPKMVSQLSYTACQTFEKSITNGTTQIRKESKHENDQRFERSRKNRRTVEQLKQFLAEKRSDTMEEAVSTISLSDVTEIESRIQALRSDLKEKKRQAEALKQECKRRFKERFKTAEESLQRQLQAYDNYIKCKEDQLKNIEDGDSLIGLPPISPCILQPSQAPRKKSVEKVPESDHTLTPTSNSRSGSDGAARENETEGSKSSTNGKIARPEKTCSSPEKSLPVSYILDMRNENRSKYREKLLVGASSEIETTDEVSDVPEDITERSMKSERSVPDRKSDLVQFVTKYSRADTNLPEKVTINSTGKSVERKVESMEFLDENKVAQLKLDSKYPNFRVDDILVGNFIDELMKKILHSEIDYMFSIRCSYKDEVDNGYKVDDVEKSIDTLQVPVKDSIAAEQTERICSLLFNELLDRAIEHCCNIYSLYKQRCVLGEFTLQHRGVTSPRSPAREKYVSECFLLPATNERSPREIAKQVDISALLNKNVDLDHQFGSDSLDASAVSIFKALTPRKMQSFSADFFSAIPTSLEELSSLVDFCVNHLYEKSPGQCQAPTALYEVKIVKSDSSDLRDLISNREADEAYRDFIFDYCGEVLESISKKDQINSRFNKAQPYHKMDESEYAYELAAFQLAKKLGSKSANGPMELFRQLNNGSPSKDRYSRWIGQCLFQWANLDPISVAYHICTGREKRVSRKKLDRVDEIILAEIYAEERCWTDYEHDKLICKLRSADQIWTHLLEHCLSDVIKWR